MRGQHRLVVWRHKFARGLVTALGLAALATLAACGDRPVNAPTIPRLELHPLDGGGPAAWAFYCTTSERQMDGVYKHRVLRVTFTRKEYLDDAQGRTGYFKYRVSDGQGVLWEAFCKVPQTRDGLDHALRRLGTSLEKVEALYADRGHRSAKSTNWQVLSTAAICPDGQVEGYDPYSGLWGCYPPADIEPIEVKPTPGNTAPPPPPPPQPPDQPYIPPGTGPTPPPSGGGGGTPIPPDESPLPCGGDERDNLIAEYLGMGVGWVPECGDFTSSARNANYSYGELTVANPHPYAVLRLSMLAGLDRWVANIGGRRAVNSGYRCPMHNWDVGGRPNSRHVYGDAVDLNVVSNGYSEWMMMVGAAKAAGATWTEPIDLPCSTNCVHADWR